LGLTLIFNFSRGSGQPGGTVLHLGFYLMTISDQIEDAKTGNAAAQKALFNALADPMMAVCSRYVKNRADAEDVVSQEDEPLAGLSAAEIFDLIVRLPVGYRTVFNLHVIEGMEHREIAQLLGIAEGTSKSQLRKAKLLLRKMLSLKGVQYVQRKNR